MNKQDILASLTPEIVASFRTAIELGKWPDGRKLTPDQVQTCMQAVMVWEHEHVPETERTGYIHKPEKEDACASHEHNEEEKPINFRLS